MRRAHITTNIKAMQQSIQEVSRFVIGSAMLMNKASEASGQTSINLDNVVAVALQENANGSKLRQTIELLADQESKWIRNTPPHLLKSDRIMHSRSAEMATLVAINTAVVATFESDGKDNDQKLQKCFVETFRAIDNTPGSTQDRRQLQALLRDQTTVVAHGWDVEKVLKTAETAYLDEGAMAILAKYNKSVDRSNDLSM